MASVRQLAAIMFTDMVGYTALMQKDEQKAKKMRDRHRSVLQNLISDHNGKILQYYGDGTLSTFGSVVDAVTSAEKIQQELNQDPSIPLRIGIHSGDIVHDDEGVYGDGVNVAARIESLSVPGAVLISGKVYDEIKNHPQFETKSLGLFEFKNVERPVQVIALANPGLKVPSRYELKGKTKSHITSVAVLPFTNMSTDPDNEYFSDGITEEILNALVRIDGLRVTSRTSSFSFKGKNEDIREIGHKLDVANLLEGSVRKAGNKVRITAQLIKATDGFHIWSETYDRSLEDIFEVQDEISHKIANQLRVTLTGKEKTQSLVMPATENIDAYNLYLKGMYHFNKWSPEGAVNCIKYFNQAIEIEPSFVLPYSGLANAYTMLGSMGQMSSAIAYPNAKRFAQKAVEMDDQLADSHVALGLVNVFYDWNLEDAKYAFEQALRLNSGSAYVHFAYYVYLVAINQFQKAVETMEIAVQLDPLSLPINANLGEVYLLNGQYKEALKQFDKTLELDPHFRSAIEGKGWTYYLMGNIEKCLECFKQHHELVQHPLKGITGLGFVYGKSGNREKVDDILSRMEKRMETEPDVLLSSDFAVVYAGLDDYDKVYEHLDNAFKNKMSMFFVMSFPIFADFRKTRQFKKLVKKYAMIPEFRP
jgi:adenylate cyclase